MLPSTLAEHQKYILVGESIGGCDFLLLLADPKKSPTEEVVGNSRLCIMRVPGSIIGVMVLLRAGVCGLSASFASDYFLFGCVCDSSSLWAVCVLCISLLLCGFVARRVCSVCVFLLVKIESAVFGLLLHNKYP